MFKHWLIRLFLLLLLMTGYGEVHCQNIDIRILRSINSPQSLPADGLFRLVSNSDMVLVGAVPAALFTVSLVQKDKKLKRNALEMAAAEVINLGITDVLKYTVNRPRPYVTYPDIFKKSDGGSPSFPSGHTSSAFAMATALTLEYPQWYIIVPSFAYAGAVGYSRMYLGVHYPSDVLAGAVVGAGSAFLAHEINKRLKSRKHLPVRKACNCPDL
jgi:membrane-associated phospholipid phosphatase